MTRRIPLVAEHRWYGLFMLGLALLSGTLLNLEKPALISAERRLLASKTVPWTAFWPPVSSWLGAIQPVTTGINKVPLGTRK